MKLRTKHPFAEKEMEWEAGEKTSVPAAVAHHPDYVEKGIELALGFMPHQGENRRMRRAAVANWKPPVVSSNGRTSGFDPENAGSNPAAATAERMPTRRELLKQRQRQRRGKLDLELRRLQRNQRKANTK